MQDLMQQYNATNEMIVNLNRQQQAIQRQIAALLDRTADLMGQIQAEQSKKVPEGGGTVQGIK